MWQSALVASILVLGQVSAGVRGDAGLLVRRSESVDGEMRRFVDSVVEPVEKRQSTTSTTMTVAEWDTETMAACTTALETLNGVASNAAGMAVCYNLPYLDNSTGVFQADLRLFTISAPTGNFVNIPQQNVMVGLSYAGATVSAVNNSAIGVTARSEGSSLISWPRDLTEMNRRSTLPVMQQAYAFVGQINKDQLAGATSASLEKLVVPIVTLTATSATGTAVNTTLNTGEASFVTGVFAVTATKAFQATAPIQTLVVASDAPFVLPGTKILIFPIGGIITGVWAVLLSATIAYGTFGRMQFRDQYRQRAARASKGDLARI